MKKYVYGCIAVVCVAYVISMLVGVFGTKVDTDFVVAGSLKSYTTHDAIIVRNEVVVRDEKDGMLMPAINNGSKTSKGETVAHVYDDNVKALLSKKEEAEKEFVDNLKTVLNKSQISNYEIQQLDDRIEEKLDLYIVADRNGNYGQAVVAERDIKELSEQRLEVIMENLPKDTYLSKLKKKVDKINRKFERMANSIKSPVAGVVCYKLDSFEKKAQYSKVNNMSADELTKLINESAHGVEDKNGSKPTFKIIDEFEYYFAVVMESNIAKTMKVGTKREILINDLQISLDAYVDSVRKSKDKYVVMFKTNSYLVESLNMRKVSLNIAESSNFINGLKVGLASLYDFSEEGTRAKIMLARAGFAEEREVYILESDEVSAIVKDVNDLSTDEGKFTNLSSDPNAVGEYDEYVVNPSNVSNGQALK